MEIANELVIANVLDLLDLNFGQRFVFVVPVTSCTSTIGLIPITKSCFSWPALCYLSLRSDFQHRVVQRMRGFRAPRQFWTSDEV